jgi:subtilisin family serine protease
MKASLIFILIIFFNSSFAQYSRYIIEFKDKKGTTHSLNNPTTFLSNESILRKKTFNIVIDSSDLPVSKNYVDSISRFSDVKLLYTSRWMNLAVIQTTNQSSIDKIKSLDFVKKQYPIANTLIQLHAREIESNIVKTNIPQQNETSNDNTLQYGKSQAQITIHEGEFLHNRGFLGEGVKIAVFDGGFFKYLNHPAFDSIRKQNKIKYTWDFVSNDASVNEDDPHGMNCLSIMGANLPGSFVGTSPHADYYLFRTEDAKSEFPIEEVYWLIAAERADSIGAQIITSSLGYTTFDNSFFDHQYNDLNGTGTIVSKAASMAVAKGMIVTNSAGNEGDDPWKYISAPADGINVLAVGAINTSKQLAGFSGLGPSADGRTKPDIVSVGVNTQLIALDGTVGIGSGTSFSNPNIAGLIACLWQAFPEFSNLEIIQSVKKSSDQFLNPDNKKGYGIPNMRIAYLDLSLQREIRNAKRILTEKNIKLYPNPVTTTGKIAYKSTANGLLSWKMINAVGQLIKADQLAVKKDEYYIIELGNLALVPRGKYFLVYQNGDEHGVLPFIK